jgi:hypothetical protein
MMNTKVFVNLPVKDVLQDRSLTHGINYTGVRHLSFPLQIVQLSAMTVVIANRGL